MIKLNITLPSGGGIAIEADDRELVREVLYSAMPHLLASPPADAGNGSAEGEESVSRPPAPAYANGASANGHSDHSIAADPPIVDAGHPHPAPSVAPAPVPAQPYLPPQSAPAETAPAAVSDPPAPTIATTPGTPAEQEFADYCQRLNPLGDMRKVVVAAEAAARHLNLQSVDPDRLAALFTLAGWPIPHSFVQTLRNAARSKFRWMERVPGLNGHYRVSDAGRSIVLGENSASASGS